MKIYRYFFNWNIDVPKSHDILLKTTDRLVLGNLMYLIEITSII